MITVRPREASWTNTVPSVLVANSTIATNRAVVLAALPVPATSTRYNVQSDESVQGLLSMALVEALINTVVSNGNVLQNQSLCVPFQLPFPDSPYKRCFEMLAFGDR